MSTVYLFRIDGAKDNDEFFAALRPSAAHVYASVDFRVGASGWIPDLVRVVIEEPPGRCALTLIELEATESVALISCRKYLPEDSNGILSAFRDYLDRIIRQCRTTADPRVEAFFRLKRVLSEARHITVTTAGALRSSIRFVEELPLLDQPKSIAVQAMIHRDQDRKTLGLRGDLRLGAKDAHVLARCIMILDAVVRHRDHSGGTFGTWRKEAGSQPLKRFLKENTGKHPTLRRFLFERRTRGVALYFETALSELVELWASTRNAPPDPEQIRSLISDFFPAAQSIKGHEHMESVFAMARKHLSVKGF